MNPPEITPGTVMPRYKWLQEDKIDFASIPARLRAMRALGVPYTNEQLANGIEIAKSQAAEVAANIVAQGGPRDLENKDIVALIAYLQRLGTDLFAKPPTTAPATPKALETPAAITSLTPQKPGAR